ncbi:hypothetical protein llap_16308 [Limosa lapponica baueri]|uniref:Uncharacterized protein n=1 Tax=Limosa lapponica baueri TaxID=1758121 RepID=A0A2I0THW2_LIMLA|nr:hypothetical protein llap_16308 [Limosa lapponica baueri]
MSLSKYFREKSFLMGQKGGIVSTCIMVKPGIELGMPSLQINTWSQSSLLPVSCLAAHDQEPSLDPCPGLSPIVISKPGTEVEARSEAITRAEKYPLLFTSMHPRKARAKLERFLHPMVPQDSHPHL